MKEKVLKDLTKECKTYFDIRNLCFMVFYKNVPLWSTVYAKDPADIKGCEIKLIESDFEDNAEKEIIILGKTPVVGMEDEFDYSTYGYWYTAEKALEWLENPYPLY